MSTPNSLMVTGDTYASLALGFPELEFSRSEVHGWPREDQRAEERVQPSQVGYYSGELSAQGSAGFAKILNGMCKKREFFCEFLEGVLTEFHMFGILEGYFKCPRMRMLTVCNRRPLR